MDKATGMYWGYLHINGELRLRDWYPGTESVNDMEEARKSPYTIRTYGPFEAQSGEEASRILQKRHKDSQII